MPRVILTLIAVFVMSSCTTQDEVGTYRPSNGLGAAWTMAALGLFGVVFPDLVSRWTQFDNRKVTRLAAGALLFAGSLLLADYYLDLDAAGTLGQHPNGS